MLIRRTPGIQSMQRAPLERACQGTRGHPVPEVHRSLKNPCATKGTLFDLKSLHALPKTRFLLFESRSKSPREAQELNGGGGLLTSVRLLRAVSGVRSIATMSPRDIRVLIARLLPGPPRTNPRAITDALISRCAERVSHDGSPACCHP